MLAKAGYIIDQIVKKGLDISLDNRNKINIEYNDDALVTLACDLLDCYKQGWDDRSVAF